MTMILELAEVTEAEKDVPLVLRMISLAAVLPYLMTGDFTSIRLGRFSLSN